MSQICITAATALGLPLDITNPGEITGATPNALVIGAAGGVLNSLAVATDGQIPIGSTAAPTVLATLTAGTNIGIVNGAGSITINAAGSGIGPTFEDDVFRILDDGDNTREIAFQADQITTGNTRTITMCDQDLSLITPSFPGTVTTGGNFSMPATNAAFTEGTFRVGGQIFLQALGTGNTFLGDTTGGSLNTGQYNTGLGFRSLLNINNANYSVALGAFACTNLTDGERNVSVGFDSLGNITDGADNIAMGDEAGSLLAGSESDNIIIGNLGTVGDNNKIRLGTTGTGPGQQNNCFIAGIHGVTPAGATQAVIIDANGELGSSAGFGIMTGFEAWDGGAPYFDDTVLGDFTLSQSGTGYIGGKPISWTAPQSVTGMTAGNTYYIYIDGTGTIQKTTTYSESLFANNIVLFECLRDSTAPTNIQVTVKENHPYQFPWSTSVWAHDTVGSVISDMQGGANITINGTQKIEISGADQLEDHGLETIIPDSGGVAVVFEQYYTLGSGKWARNAQSDTFDGTWNNAGTPTAIGTNKYTVNRLYVCKDDIASATPTYFSIMGDAEYNNLAQADTAIANDSIPTATGELAQLEVAQLGYIVYEESTASIVQVVIAKETLRSSFSGVTATTASLVLTDTTNFDHILSAADTTVQSALETIDDLTLAGDSGTAQAASAVFTIAGGTGITSAAAGSTVTVNLDSPVAVANGGTGVSTTTAYAVLCGGTTTTNPLQSIASVGTAGQVLTSNGAGALPTFQAVGGIIWNEVTGTSQAAAVNNGYVANNASQVTITLPDTAAFGSVVKVMGKGAGGWKIAQNAGETIRWDESTVTTTGTGGYLESTDDHDAIELVCTTANTVWTVGPGAKGNINVV